VTQTRAHHVRRPGTCPLLPPAARRVAAALVAICVAVTAFLGVWFAGQTRAGWLDGAVDGRIRAALGGHTGALDRLAALGNPIPVNAMAAALLLACLATRRWRGAVLVAVAAPAAQALSELLLKPAVGRTLRGALSYPSGTATGMFAVAATFAVLLAVPARPPIPAAARLLLALAALGIAAAVSLALVGLGAHYFTDTVGGASVATAVVVATALGLDKLGQWQRPMR
jgi:membrane-associated phospholipid phosphatase